MMTALEFLKRPMIIERRLNAALRKVELYKSLTERVTVSLGGETVSRSRDMTANETAIIRLMEAEDTVLTLRAEYMKIVDETTDMLSCLTEDFGEEILFLHYVKKKTFREIGKELFIGHSQTFEHHDMALRELDALLDEKSGQNRTKSDKTG